MRGIYQKDSKSKVWWIRYADSAGRIHREKAGSEAAAKQLYSIRKTGVWTEKKLPHTIKRKPVSFGDLTKAALAHLDTQPHRSGGDDDRIQLLSEVFGDVPAESIRPADIEAKLGAIATERKWKPATQNRHKAVLSLIYRLAVKNGKVTINPARLVRRLPEDNQVVRFLTPDEEAELRKVLEQKHPERWAFIKLALHTGCRAGELKNLRWTEVTDQITLLTTKNKTMRHIPLNTDALAALEVLRSFELETGYVCPRQHYRVWFEKALLDANIDGFRFHDLRHTFASRCTMAGVDIRTLAQLMGHKTLQMSARYSHLAPQHLADAVSKLVGFGTGTKTSTATVTHS